MTPRWQAGKNRSDKESAEESIDPAVVLRDLSGRWRVATTVEYRSKAVMAHIGEVRVEVRNHILLRRPNMARMVFIASRTDYSRLRVCDGLRISDRNQETEVRAGRTLTNAFRGSMTEDLPHPLELAGYSVDQFFSPVPFYPPRLWGEGDDKVETTAVRIHYTDPSTGRRRDRFRITFKKGRFRDTLTVDATSYAPIEIIRFGVHAEMAQVVMSETFESVRLDPNLPVGLFRWTQDDEAGRTLRL